MKTSVGGNWALRQMRELVRIGVDVHVVLPSREGLWSDYAASGVKTHLLQSDFPMGKPWLFLKRSIELGKLIKAIRPDILHSHFVGSTLVMRASRMVGVKLPRIFQVPGPLHLESPIIRKMEIVTANTDDHWIGTCRKTCEVYRRAGISTDRVFLSYYGVDLDRMIMPRPNGKLRRTIAVDSTTPVVGMVAYMYAPKKWLGYARGIKGHEDLIDAIAVVKRSLPELKVVFIGGAWNRAYRYENQIHLYARKKIGNSAIFLGTRKDVFELYPDFNVAVHPSHSENLGGAAESLLLGVPTIATRVGGFPDIVTPGVTGWLVPPKKPKALAAAIVQAITDPQKAEEIAHRGHRHLTDMLNVKTTACRVKTIYETILEQRCESGMHAKLLPGRT
jgi:glycosyltransferase involved in cell wall biosynthesis